MKPAKSCYEHLGGKLGELLFENFKQKGWVAQTGTSKNYYITPEGEKEFTAMGIDLAGIKDQ